MAKRIKDAVEIERRLLELAYTSNVKLTAAALAYYAPCSIEDASRVLDDLAAHERVRMDIEDDGTITYALLGRPVIPAPAPAPMPLPPARASWAPPLVVQRPAAASALAAVVLTIFLPGAGHLYASRIGAAIFWFVLVSLGYVLIIPGLLFHAMAMFSAASAARATRALPVGPVRSGYMLGA
ncbi:MAG TPA: hypothetical protein VG916_06595, partial [Gemmatimonadaceae bacterium]|nr:hypothetical protein [Gemmatimonadaceae bacterium]